MQTFKVKKLVQALGCSLFLTLAACSDDQSQEQENLIQVQAYLGLAEVYMNQGQFRASVIETQNAFELMPNNPDVLSFICRLYLEIGDLAEATKQIDAALQISPDDPELKLLKVQTLLASSKLDEGITLLNATVVPPDLSVEKTWLLGNLQAASGNNEAAEATFKEAVALDNVHVPSLIALARLAYISGNAEDVIVYTDRASSAATPDDPDVFIWKAQLAMLQENYAAAETAYKEALDIMAEYDIMTVKKYTTLESILLPLRALQKNDEALTYAGIIANTPQGQFNTAFNNVVDLFRQGTSTEAETALNSLLETAPDHPASNILLGLTKYSDGEFSEAERLLSEYVQTDTASPQLLAALAQTHLQMNRPEKALAVLQQAAEASPGNTSILAMIGTIQRGMGDLDGALATLTTALQSSPDSPELLMGVAGIYVLQGDDAKAISSLEKAIEVAPDAEAPKAALLNLLSTQQTQDPDAAEEHIDSWLATNPDSSQNNVFAGILSLREKNPVEARAYFEKVLAADPNNLDAKLYLARTYSDEQNYAEAEKRFDAIAAEHPSSPDAVGAILALGNLTNTQAASVQRVEQLIAQHPDQFVPPLVLGQYHLLANDLPKALEFAEKAFSVAENSYTQNLLIDLLLRSATAAADSGNSATATPFLDRVLAIQNNNAQAHYMIAGLAARDGNYLRAMDEVNLLRGFQPNTAVSYELEGDILSAQDKNTEALTAYQAGWEKEKGATLGMKIFRFMQSQNQADQAMAFLQSWTEQDASAATPHMLMGMEHQMKNREKDAIDAYEKSYKLDQTSMVVLNNLAWLYQDSSPARALELSAQAAELYPQNPDVLDTHGWILYKQGRTANALSQLENAAKLAPDSASIKEHLSIVRSEQQ